jgi:UDP-N-acetylmuramate--alanine ligase
MEHIHLTGIGGSGLSAIARLLLEMGYKVSGSDRVDSPVLSGLRKLGADIQTGYHPEKISQANLVLRSSAIPDDNPEVVAARQAGIQVLKRADFLSQLMVGKTGIAIAGTHGKTTTTAMLAWVLTALGRDPSFLVGGVIRNLGINAHAGKGDLFVIEADEYDQMFLGLKPGIEIITNIEHDHPDCYPTPQSFYSAFEQFVDLLPPCGSLIACGQDPQTVKLISHARENGSNTYSYAILDPGGPEMKIDIYARGVDLSTNPGGCFSFEARIGDQASHVDLQVPGRHNVMNSLAVLSTTCLLNLPLDEAALAVGDFLGTNRRFEIRGEPNGLSIIDDYAHHPSEIRATLAAARTRFPGRRIVVVWQPHTYSRTQLLKSEFSQAFVDADQVVVTEVFAARETDQGFSAKQVVDEMKHANVQFLPHLPEVSSFLIDHLIPGDVLLVLSAGDADQVTMQVLQHFMEGEVNNA